MAGAFDHHLNPALPTAISGQFPKGFELGKLSLVIGIGQANLDEDHHPGCK